MKRVTIFRTLIYTIILSVFFISCSESVTHEYSHDSSIDSWIKENKKEVVNYNRNKIKSFSRQKQKAILNSMSAKSKKQIWQEKVTYISSLNLPNEDKQYIKWFVEIFKKIDYNKTTPKHLSDEMLDKVNEA
jgi:hypothetical protein